MNGHKPYSALLLAVGLTLGGTAAARQPDALELVCKRFYTAAGLTHVDAFARVSLAHLTVVSGAGTERFALYRMAIEVVDSDGMVLTSSDWTREVPERFLGVSGASTGEHFAFAVHQGSYVLRVTVADSASGEVLSKTVSLDAYEGSPFVSDLLLTSDMRRSPSDEIQLAPGEINKGGLYLVATPRPVLTYDSPTLYYYVEHYSDAESSLETTAAIIGADGREFVSIPERVELTGQGGVMARAIPLAGLPMGEYQMRLTVRYPDTVVVRNAAFEMQGLVAVPSEMFTAANPFAYYTELQLDSLYGPLMLLADASERGIYEYLSVEGKRNFLNTFWNRRDETPATAENEALTRFYGAIAETARRFRERGSGDIPGWRTDRGRVFLKYGEPDDVLRRPVVGFTNPYEVWKYSRGRPLRFIFYDDTGFGNYVLIHSNDRSEAGYGNWETLLGEEAVEDALNF